MSKGLRHRLYGLSGGAGVLATVAPRDIGWTLPRQAIKRLRVPTRARINVQFFPGGPWDLAAEPFDIHRYVRDIFVDQVPVSESEQYRDMVARVSDPRLRGSVWGCRTIAEVDQYFEGLHAVFEDMRRNGYRSHEELGASPRDEVKVRVGRDGQLIKASGGNHRVSFAKLLGIDRIPVLLSGVHEGYLGRFARRAGARDASMLVGMLDSAGLVDYRESDVEQLARRLEVGNALRAAAEFTRRRSPSGSRLSEGSLAIASLVDDAYLLLAKRASGYGLLPLLGA